MRIKRGSPSRPTSPSGSGSYQLHDNVGAVTSLSSAASSGTHGTSEGLVPAGSSTLSASSHHTHPNTTGLEHPPPPPSVALATMSVPSRHARIPQIQSMETHTGHTPRNEDAAPLEQNFHHVVGGERLLSGGSQPNVAAGVQKGVHPPVQGPVANGQANPGLPNTSNRGLTSGNHVASGNGYLPPKPLPLSAKPQPLVTDRGASESMYPPEVGGSPGYNFRPFDLSSPPPHPYGSVIGVLGSGARSESSDYDAEWTPQDSSYGAACPVCGFIPKRIRRLVESSLIVIGLFFFVGAIVKVLAPLIESVSHNEGKESGKDSKVSGRITDDDYYVETVVQKDDYVAALHDDDAQDLDDYLNDANREFNDLNTDDALGDDGTDDAVVGDDAGQNDDGAAYDDQVVQDDGINDDGQGDDGRRRRTWRRKRRKRRRRLLSNGPLFPLFQNTLEPWLDYDNIMLA